MSDQPLEPDVPAVDPRPSETEPLPPEAVEAHDDEDVPLALARETEDGPGDVDKLPAEDFDSFATDDVEEEQ